MGNRAVWLICAVLLTLAFPVQAGRDITVPGDIIQGVPNDGISTDGSTNGWPSNESPRQAIDDQVVTKYLHFRGEVEPTGLRITPAAGLTVVTGLSFTTANDAESRDPVKYELSGSNESIDGPYTLIAAGDVEDLAGAAAWPRLTKGTTPIRFANTAAYRHYQLLFPAVRNAAIANSMQIAEIELLTDVYVATSPIPANGAIGVTVPLVQWTAGDAACFHHVYFGTNPNPGAAEFMGKQPSVISSFLYLMPLQPGITYYWRIDEVDATGRIATGDVWSFTAQPMTAYAPKPPNGAVNLFPGPVLSWSPGMAAAQHQVFFGSRLADVMNGTAAADSGKTTETKFTPGALRASTTYYWRVDEIQGDGTTSQGHVWSFTTADGVENKIVRQWWMDIRGTAVSDLTGSPNFPNDPSGSELLDVFEAPVDWADNYGTLMYGWLKPPETGDYRFWVAGDDTQELWLSTDEDPAHSELIARVSAWTPFREWAWETGQKSAVIKLQAGRKYFIKALGKEGGGGDSTAVAWQPPHGPQAAIPGKYVDTFPFPPDRVFSPEPINRSANVGISPTLAWAVDEKTKWDYDVYFGESAGAVAAANTGTLGIYQGRQREMAYDPGILDWNKTYYWRVDMVNDADPSSPYKGNIWSFTAADSILIEDFESYHNDSPNTVSDVWRASPGATVGYAAAPFAEQVFVHRGKQSMPLAYDLTQMDRVEAWRTWQSTSDWTVAGVNTLSLWFRGNPGNYPARLYIVIVDAEKQESVVYHPDPHVTAEASWQKWAIPLGSFPKVDLKRVESLRIGVSNPDTQADLGTTAAGVSAASDNDATGVVDIDTITLEVFGYLDGTLRDIVTGSPIAGATLTVAWDEDNASISYPPTEEDGLYSICLGPGTYKITITQDQYLEAKLAFEPMGYVTYRDVLLTPKSCPPLKDPMYRFVSPKGSWHFTMEEPTRDRLLYDEEDIKDSDKWTYTGIGFCNSPCNGPPSGQRKPVYVVWCKKGEYMNPTEPSYPIYTANGADVNDLLQDPTYYEQRDGDIAFPAYDNPDLPAVHRFRCTAKPSRGYYYTISTDAPAEEWVLDKDVAWRAFDCLGSCK